MNAQNNLTQKVETKKPSLSAFLSKPETVESLSAVIQDEKERVKFIASITSAYAANPAMRDCTYSSIVSTALTAHSLNLSLSPQLGFCYAIPFKVKQKVVNGKTIPEHTDAQFQMGYRGYIQLAIRTGYYEDIDVLDVREGEYLGRDAMTGRHRFAFIADDDLRENKPIIGYLAYFVQLNGFKKQLYWSKEKMLKHADRYSQAFSLNGNDKKVSYADYLAGKYPKADEWKYSSFWYTSFDDMAFKTMIKQLISKWGIMSLDMQKALKEDDNADFNTAPTFTSAINEDGEVLDTPPVATPVELPPVEAAPPVATPVATPETNGDGDIPDDDVISSFFDA